jgi:hypothetical protein
MSKIYQEDVSSFILELHDFIERHPLTTTEEGFDYLADFVEQRFEKFWPKLYDGEYQNYN